MPTPLALQRKALSKEDVMNAAGHVFEQWQRDFARWLAGAGKRALVKTQLEKLQELTAETWTPARLKGLRDSGLFREYLRVLREGGVALARERLAEIAPKAVDRIEWAMDAAHKEGDYANMPKITGQILERVIPRRDDLTQQRLTINIGLSDKQKALLESTPIDVEFEAID
jgi:hypothetical protein